MEICNYLEFLIEVVKRDDGVREHEQRFRDFQDIFQGSCRFGFEVADTVVANIADCSASKGWEIETWNSGFAVLGELLLEDCKGVGFRAMARTRLQHFSRVL